MTDFAYIRIVSAIWPTLTFQKSDRSSGSQGKERAPTSTRSPEAVEEPEPQSPKKKEEPKKEEKPKEKKDDDKPLRKEQVGLMSKRRIFLLK